MGLKKETIDRRNFLKTLGVVGLSSVLAKSAAVGDTNLLKTVEPNIQKRLKRTIFR